MISLKESLIRKNRDIDIENARRDDIISFLFDNYNFIVGGWRRIKTEEEINKYIIYKDKNYIDIIDGVSLQCKKLSDTGSLTNNNFKFEKVWSLQILPGTNIEYIKDAPKIIKSTFNCSNCNKLRSLEGAPETIGYLRCSACSYLKDLKGLSNVRAEIDVDRCAKLSSLKGIPTDFRGTLSICKTNIHTIKDVPKTTGLLILSDDMQIDDLYIFTSDPKLKHKITFNHTL